ncbi:double-stranded RNA-binding protein Staufen homolog 2 [Phlebotomus argentipes]|uniref:double-stranded RNA-binding protein Staufen homolog 2 n=1 Tax=Phlebotomus argentipes TaxID=94469 RepID=UPI002892C98C|nr:double-stranded RNA-binding protein Staufen homolog 2 [Phlebotomus argentipes]
MMHHNNPTHHPHMHPHLHPSLQQQHAQHLGQQMPHHMAPSMGHSAPGQHHGFPREQINRSYQRINQHQIHQNHGRVAKAQSAHHNSMIIGQHMKPGRHSVMGGGGVPAQMSSHHHKKQHQQKSAPPLQVPPNQSSQATQRLLQTIEIKTEVSTNNNPPQEGPNIPTVSVVSAAAVMTSLDIKPNIDISGPEDPSTDNTSQSATSETLANIKEKTPMCLVNELARHNKIQHQYRLTSEQGPAHKKKFTVILKLGEEEYTAEGPSIKKAQHTAAADAISATKYKHPPTKTNRIRGGKVESHVGNITPTVELNALAMKRGEQTIYMNDHPIRGMNGMQPYAQTSGNGGFLPTHPLTQQYNSHQYGNYHSRNVAGVYQHQLSRFQGFDKRPLTRSFPQRNVASFGHFGGNSFEPYRVTLTVGERKFVGVGATQQAARHDAAARALEVLKPITTDSPSQDVSLVEDINTELKSPISLVHEMALKRNLTVAFEVKMEKGPPHMKVFITICNVGTLKTEGEGNGKKISKKRAAEAMLEELKKLPPISPTLRVIKPKRKPQDVVKKKSRNLIKEKDDPEYTAEVNPISKLIQIQQSKKEKEPIYTVAEERGVPRRREFVIEVAAGGYSAVGVGSNKKVAKRLAAENLLALMGYVTNDKEKSEESEASVASVDKSKKVTFQEQSDSSASSQESQGGSAGRQLVPGLLLIQQKDAPAKGVKNPVLNPQTTAAIAKEILASGTSPTADALTKGGGDSQANNNNNEKTSEPSSPAVAEGIRPKDQLLYLAQLIGFNAQFSDFPKGNHGEFLTLITLSTDPPQLCHGSGNSIEASHDQASTKMLTMLSKLGLDNVHPVNAQPTSTSPVDDKKPKPILSNGLKK